MPGEHYRLDDFARDEGTFVYAMLREDTAAPLVRLEPGAAEQRRSFTRRHLKCPLPTCPTPALTTVNRSAGGRRDGYRHLRLADRHSHEGFFHLLAKAAVLHWARQHPSIAEAATEARAGPRIADVLLTGHHGHRIAVEIQYSALSVDEWRERSESYREQDITPVWLWGHIGHHGPSTSGPTRLRGVHREVALAKQPLLWINPTDETLAWATTTTGNLPRGHETHVTLRFTPMDHALTITPSGLFPNGWRQLAEAAQARLDEASAAREEREQAERAARERAAAIRQRQAERARANAETSWEYWERVAPMRPGEVCDVCKYPVLPGQARVRRRHDVCAYLT